MEQDPQFQRWLRPEESLYAPLTHNFYEAFLRRNPGYNPSMETSSASSPNTSSNSETSKNAPSTTTKTTSKPGVTSKLVKEILESNKQLIEEAAMQRAAGAVNVTTAQYSNLTPLSFDEEQFIRNYEASNR